VNGPTRKAHTSVDPAALDLALARAGCASRSDENWTACRAPEHVLQICANGGLRPCEFGNRELLEASDDWLAAWRSPEFEALRTTLSEGRVPADYCRSCANSSRVAMTAQAPLVRDYGGLERNPSDQPSRIVLQLPADGPIPMTPGQLGAALQGARQLVVACSRPLSEQLGAGWLEPLQALDVRPHAFLRLSAIGDLDACTSALRSIQVRDIEVAIAGPDTTELAKAIELAKPHRADVRARFVITPDNWFWLEATAHKVAELGAQLELRTMDYDGATPITALSPHALGFIKSTLVSGWRRFADDDRPSSLAPDAFSGLIEELRGALEAQIADELEEAEACTETKPGLPLPALDHPYFTAAEYAPWFYAALFGNSHLDILHDWIDETTRSADGEQLLRDHSGLRTLTQKLAFERRTKELLQCLRTLYADPDRATSLLEADAAFAEAVDLTPYRGPWTGPLRLQPAPRPAPFEVSTTTAALDASAQITILIPSYKHGLYIADTIRSALAQQDVPVRVLVVDDQSPDDTVEVARSIQDPRLEVRVNEQNLGLGNSVLRALETIETPYVALLNSDDLLHPHRIARCLEVLNSSPQTQVVTTGLSLIDHLGGELTPDNVSLVMDGIQVFNWVGWYEAARITTDLPQDQVFEELLERNFLATSSNLTARTDWLRQRHRAFQNLKYCLDWQIFLEAALDGSLHHIPEPLAGYRLHATNTVWFEEGGRWAFFLEVNRVLSDALKHHVQLHGTVDEALVHRATSAIANHIAKNREADGHALFLNAIFDGLAVDRIAAESERIQELLRSMRQVANAALQAQDAKKNDHSEPEATLAHKQLLTKIQRERLQADRDSLQHLIESLRHALDRLKNQADRTKSNHDAAIERLRAEKQSLHEKIEATRTGYEKRITDGNQREQSARNAAKELRQRLTDVQERLQEKLAARRADIERLQQRAASIRSELDAKSEQYATKSEQYATLSAQHQEVSHAHEQLSKDHRLLAEQRDDLEARNQHQDREIQRLSERRNQLITEGSHLRAELEKLSNSREYRAGNFLWNKLPLGYMSRRAKKWYNRLVDLKDRVSLWAGGKVKKPTAEGVAVVASCWHWPIYSHTFVYQEMIGLNQMGLDLKMFHWADNDLDQLQPAFAYLKDNRVQLKANMKQHRKDKEHFEKTRPGRLDELLQRLSGPTGKTVEELAEEPMVLRACTFARMAELANARYLHSYFFYDQSFMTFVAAWLLDIPRGVSCYADHMMDDFPFKVVALQLQMASVVVATSARIKTELVEIGGEECADKIVVKPNGVNGERFPAIDRGERKPEDPFEVISISRLEPKKGLEFLIEAVAELKKRGRKIKAHLIGAVDTSIQASIDYGAELEHQIKKLGLEEEVILHGMQMHEAIAPIMKASRAFVAPYVELESGDKDGIPTAILEALASGLPIVTTDSGSILEIVQDGVQALVTPQRDSAAYTEALDKLITNPSLERQLAKEARKRFDAEFDIKVTERRLHERVAAALHPTPVAR